MNHLGLHCSQLQQQCASNCSARGTRTSMRPSPSALNESLGLGRTALPLYENSHERRRRCHCKASSSADASASGPAPYSRAAPPPRPRSQTPSRASEALEKLRLAQQESVSALKQRAPVPGAGSPGMVDVRMYQQVVTARNRFSQKLSEAKSYTGYLERRLEDSNEQLTSAVGFINKVSMEFGATSRLAEGAIAAAQFGVDKADAIKKLEQLMARLKLLEQAVLKQQQELHKGVPRKVPMVWQGVASEVKVMGEFDAWTHGLELSADEMSPDSVYATFNANLLLLPGTYRVKFMVDGEWRLAPDWPSETTEDGDTNNILVVT